jgi:hypothetical protein
VKSAILALILTGCGGAANAVGNASLGKWMGIPDALSGGVNPTDLVSPNQPAFPVRDLACFL